MDGRGKDAPPIGIDLGTTYSCVAVWKHDHIQIIPNDQGNRTTPSCVAFVDAERLVGDGAKNQVAMNPANTIFDAKRLIGRKFSDSKVQDDIKLWPFRVIEGPSDTPKAVAYGAAVMAAKLISGIPPAPKGCIKFKDCFEIEANGILTVTSEIILTGKMEKLTITNTNGRLSKKEIEKMIEDADKYKLADQEYKKKADAFNALEDCLYKMKNMIENMEHGERLRKMEHAIAYTTKWLDQNQSACVDELQHMKEYLEAVCMPTF